MAERLRQLLRRLREKCMPARPLAPFLGCLFAVVGELFHSSALRWLCRSIAVLLFVYVIVELADSLLDHETGYASYQPPPKHIPITPFQIFFTLSL